MMDRREFDRFLEGLDKFGISLGLERITCLLDKLGRPQDQLEFIHVAGTNGKGSTSAMMASILQAQGFRVGLFTSPHLIDYRGRIRFQGKPVAEGTLLDLAGEIRLRMEEMVREGRETPTEFEFTTALALKYFVREGVQVAVMEAGMGGEGDATNVIAPRVTVITNVALDHTEYLGAHTREIARTKSGIIKAGCPVVTAVTDPPALEVLEKVCRERGAPLVRVGRDITYELERVSLEGQAFSLRGQGNYPGLFVPLLGEHQLANAATAVAALEWLPEVSREAIYQGLSSVDWPGRLEVIGRDPLVVLDAAHNEAAARALARSLASSPFTYRRMILVLGILEDKPWVEVVRALAPMAQAVIVTQPVHLRAGNWHQVAQEARKYCSNVLSVAAIPIAVSRALGMAEARDLVCITGSFYTVGPARDYLSNLGGKFLSSVW